MFQSKHENKCLLMDTGRKTIHAGGHDDNDHHLDSASTFLNSKWVMQYINLCWNVPRNPITKLVLA